MIYFVHFYLKEAKNRKYISTLAEKDQCLLLTVIIYVYTIWNKINNSSKINIRFYKKKKKSIYTQNTSCDAKATTGDFIVNTDFFPLWFLQFLFNSVNLTPIKIY